MKIYTKTGDKGTTSLYGGKKVSKDNIRVEAYGNIDELNAYVGLLRDQAIDQDSKKSLLKIQNELFVLGSLLATPPEKVKKKSNTKSITLQHISFLENEIDKMTKYLAPMTHFILPGGHPIVSYCHIARNVCRRAERRVVHLSEESLVDGILLGYLNRLSDYFFVLARKLSKDLGVKETLWIT